MNLRSLILLRTVFSAIAIALALNSVRAQIDGGEVRVRSDLETTKVMVRSANSNTQKLVNTAFTIHGGFAVVGSQQEAHFYVTVDPLGPSGARLSIGSGIPEQTLFTETLAGQSNLDAVYKAIDRAISKMRREPGFFSGKIAFINEASGASEVCVSDILFQNPTQLTSDGVSSVRPHWSPDGNYIVYTSYKGGFPDIYRLDLREKGRDVIADYKGTNSGARYSPDGRRLAMILSGSANANADVWVRESNGTMKNLTRSRGLEAAPDWSPDGTRLVFSSDERGGPQLYVMPSQGGSMRRLPTNISGYCAEPDWNPVHSNLIAFTAAEGSGYQIAIYNSKTSKSEFVTTESGDAIEPQWLNDGRHLLYTHRRANRSEIKILDTISGKRYVLSGSLAKVSQPSFVKVQ